MNIRDFKKSDIEKAKEIHEKYYKTEFEFPNFFSNFLCSFVVENDKGIISAGGVRVIPEIILVTDKDYSVRERQDALYQVLNVSTFIANKFKHDQLHVFVQDSKWEEHLRKVGFTDCTGKALYLGV